MSQRLPAEYVYVCVCVCVWVTGKASQGKVPKAKLVLSSATAAGSGLWQHVWKGCVCDAASSSQQMFSYSSQYKCHPPDDCCTYCIIAMPCVNFAFFFTCLSSKREKKKCNDSFLQSSQQTKMSFQIHNINIQLWKLKNSYAGFCFLYLFFNL